MIAAGRIMGPKAISLTAIRFDVSKTVTKSALRASSSGEVRAVDRTALSVRSHRDRQGVTVSAVAELTIVPSPFVSWIT